MTTPDILIAVSVLTIAVAIAAHQVGLRRGNKAAQPSDAELMMSSSLKTVFAVSPDGICVCRNGTIVHINHTGLRLIGAKESDEVRGQPFGGFIHPDYRLLCDNNFAALIGEREATPMKILRPSGRVLDVQVAAHVNPDCDGEVVVSIRDISDFMRANRDVAAQIKRLNSILDTAVDAVVVTDDTGLIETFNRSAVAMFGFASGEIIGKAFDGLFAADPSIPQNASVEQKSLFGRQMAMAGGHARHLVAKRKDGSVFPVEMSLSVCNLDSRQLYTAMIRDITERRNFENNLAYSATHDGLTGLPNRTLLQDRLVHLLAQRDIDKGVIAAWFIDLDGFKVVNDVMGHAAGDELMIQAGRRMVEAVRPGDTVARFGGDEFALVIGGLRSSAEVVARVEDFIAEMCRPFMLMGREVILSISVGISIFPDHTEMGSDLLLDASAAMLFAKSSGHNQYRFFDPSMHRQSAERLMMENELRRGIDKGELLLHYQPQVSVATGRIVGMEALVRWRHPGLGLVPPGRFIPVAEQSGLIVPLGEWVMRQACHDLRQLESLGLANVTMAINISAKQFSDSDVVGAIQEAIRASGIEASHLDVEITESTLMHDPANVVGFLDRLKSLGIRLSIDDFGTGFSSLNYLKRFPIDTLKIDQSFITDIAHNTKDEAIAVTIITLAHAMGMTALAEGVESPAQEHILERHGCDVIQGFLYSKPVPLAEIKAMLTSGATLPPGSDGQRDIKFN